MTQAPTSAEQIVAHHARMAAAEVAALRARARDQDAREAEILRRIAVLEELLDRLLARLDEGLDEGR